MAINNRNDDFDSSTYVKVNDRLVEFWTKYPNGRITTFVTETKEGFVVKTVLVKDVNSNQEYGLTGVADATGHAFLSYDDLSEKALEATETASVGRALAIMGFRIERSIASREEMNRWSDKNNKKKEKNSPPPTTQTANEGEGEAANSEPPLPKLKASNRFKMPAKATEAK